MIRENNQINIMNTIINVFYRLEQITKKDFFSVDEVYRKFVLVSKRDCSKTTIYKYLNLLVFWEILIKKPDNSGKRLRYVYKVLKEV